MKAPPSGWPRMSTALFYDDPAAAIDWLGRAFGFEPRLKVEDDEGEILHSELVFGGGVLMVNGTRGDGRPGQEHMASPREAGGTNTQCVCVYVDDVDAHCQRARAAGAVIFREPAAEDHGPEHPLDKSYGARDPEGHLWFFMQRLRNGGGR